MKLKKAFLITVLAFLVILIFYLFAFSQPDYERFVPATDILFIFVSLATVIITFLTFKVLGWQSREGKVWFFFSLSFFMYFLGEVLWAFYDAILKVNPFPSFADIFYVGHKVFLITAFLIELKTIKSTLNKKQIAISALFTIGVAVAIFYLIIAPIASAADYDILSKILSLSYPIADIIILFPVLLSIFVFKGGRISKSWLVIKISVLTILAGDAYFSYLDWNELYFGVNMMAADLLWLASYISFAFGAYYYKYVMERKK